MTVVAKKLTPVLLVDAIEPCLPFWEALGFAPTVTVPEGERLGFAILANGSIEVMVQSLASVEKDIPALAEMPSATTLYLEVADLDAVLPAIAGAPVVVERRKTFYGADEIGVREPAGNVVIFSRPS